MDPYLAASAWLDHDHPTVEDAARRLRGLDEVDTARRCYHFVRDGIRHTGDAGEGATTCRASDALALGTGWCYAKAHLLAALLRANGIPAALCYQKLALDGAGPPYVLHGLVAARLPVHGWYRMDPRGTKPGVNAEFDPPQERLAFAPANAGVVDLPGLHAEPLPQVVACLTRHPTAAEVAANLPDA